MNSLHKMATREGLLWKWALLVCLWGIWCGEAQAAEPRSHTANPSQTRTVIDMAGRNVTVPSKINRIATVGAVPVINGCLFALGEKERIVNGLPYFTPAKWKMQIVVAPHLAGQPVLQGQGRSINMEALIRLRPDVVITMDVFAARALENSGIPVIFLEWNDASGIRANMKLLGRLLDRTARSDEYLRYFEATVGRVRRTLGNGANNPAPRVLFFNPGPLRAPLPITEWLISEAGGKSVTAGISRIGTGGYSHEQVLLWNPDIMIVSTPEQVARVYEDKRLSRVRAVLAKRVYVMPVGTHPWSQRTVEQPLAVLWAAKAFYPERFRHVRMEDEVRTFYKDFFDYNLSDRDIREILAGGAG